jgi:hypothetical protein
MHINAASRCFGAVHGPSSGNSQFLVKYVYANVMGAKDSEVGVVYRVTLGIYY